MRNFDESLKKLLKDLGIDKRFALTLKAEKLKNYLVEKYGEEWIGSVKPRGSKILVEIKSSSLRNELFMKKEELLNFLRENIKDNLPEDLVFVGRL